MTIKFVIRTSDRKNFKKCRRAWDIGSKIRQNLEPVAIREPLEFGTLWHTAMEEHYDPAFWHLQGPQREAYHALIQIHFQENVDRVFAELVANRNDEPLDDEEIEMRTAWKDLGRSMLDGFFKWAVDQDKWFTPVYVEQEFEVPIVVPKDMSASIPHNFIADPRDLGENDYDVYLGQLRYNPVAPSGRHYYQVFYQGRIDLIVRDMDGKYWIWDHKTAGRLDEDMSWLDLDEQMKSYAWAIQRELGIKIEGVIYMEYYKGYARPPKILERPYKGRWISTNKQQQDTSLELMQEAIAEHDPHGDYEEYLQFLREEGKVYFRRIKLRYNDKELENIGRQIVDEAIDMLDSPRIYPSPDKFKCRYCDHRHLCLAMNDGSDTSWIIASAYKQTEPQEVTGE